MDNYKDDGSGFSLEEFKSVMSKNLEDRYSRNEIKKIFDLFDENKSQKINFQNLRTIADEIGEAITDDELNEIIEEADKDGDGELNFQEFYNIMKRRNEFYDDDD